MVGDQSKPNQRPTKKQQKKKKKKDKDIYISVLFSIMPEDMMKTYKHSKFTIDGKQYESVWMVKPSKTVWKKGKFNKNKINTPLFIDCSELVINIDTGEVDDGDELMYLMDVTMVKIHRELLAYQSKYKDKTLKLHFILGSDTECQDLLYATHFVCDKTMADKIKDAAFSSFVNSKYSSYFSQFTGKGWSVKVDYCGAYEIKIIHAPIMPSQEKGEGSSKATDKSNTSKKDDKKGSSKNNSGKQQLDLLDVDEDAIAAEKGIQNAGSTPSKPANDKGGKKQLELLDFDADELKKEIQPAPPKTTSAPSKPANDKKGQKPLELLDYDDGLPKKNNPPAPPKTKSAPSKPANDKNGKKQLELLDLDY